MRAHTTGVTGARTSDSIDVETNLDLPCILVSSKTTLTLLVLNKRIDVLIARKRRLEREQRSHDTRSLLEFLLTTRSHKQETLDKIAGELAILDRDIVRIRQRLDAELDSDNATVTPSGLTLPFGECEPEVPVIQEDLPPVAKRPFVINPSEDMDASSSPVGAPGRDRSLLDTKALIHEHYSDLQACYFDDSLDDPLTVFGEKISRLSRLTRIRQVSTLKLGDIAGSSNIVSSIEFDRDAQLFATAGVSKKIRFYEFRDALNSRMDLHCPVREITCKSKLSCISWNPYVQSQIAAADYEGLVTVYDSATGQPMCHLEEHEKRSWTVDFSSTDPTRLASGSDDCTVKLWSVKSKKSIYTIDGKANICSVRFHPEIGHLLAYGSADHNVHVYDLRNSAKPLDILRGHKKAVSYVRFTDDSNVVSASTDCTLKLWILAGQDTKTPVSTSTLARSYSGHVNEKNFVGLAVQGDLLACGSENNSVYLYHRDLSKPLATFRFTLNCPITDSSMENEAQQFVSSVCWKTDSNMLVAANSLGNIRVLEIV